MYYPTDSRLTYAIKKAAVLCGDGKQFSRKSALSAETLMRLLVGAEGGSLDKILHAAGIEVTASAVSPATFRRYSFTLGLLVPLGRLPYRISFPAVVTHPRSRSENT